MTTYAKPESHWPGKDAVREYLVTVGGFVPTREIAAHFGFTSNEIHGYLGKLHRDGHIRMKSTQHGNQYSVDHEAKALCDALHIGAGLPVNYRVSAVGVERHTAHRARTLPGTHCRNSPIADLFMCLPS